MTEAEWLSCSDPKPMLKFIAGQANDRQLRLFACACCRSIEQFLPAGPFRPLVEVSLRFADGTATADELAAARAVAIAETDHNSLSCEAMWAACETANPSASRAARIASDEAREQVRKLNLRAEIDEASTQANVLCDIIGNPFRRVWIEPVQRLRRYPKVREAAEELYDDAPQQDMEALADILEGLGCSDRAVLTHCRAATPHVKGCWVLDLLLDREHKDGLPSASSGVLESPAILRPEIEAIRNALVQHLGAKRYRRFLRKTLPLCHLFGDSRPEEWAEFLAQRPECDIPGIKLIEVCRVCTVHNCELAERVVSGPTDPPELKRKPWYLQARGTKFPYAHPLTHEAESSEERVIWFCPKCQEAWTEWERLRKEFDEWPGEPS